MKLFINWSWLHAFVIVVIAIGCTNNEFEGARDANTPINNQTVLDPTTVINPQNCAQGIANVELLNESLFGIASQVNLGLFRPQRPLLYSIKLNCNGRQVPLNNVAIAFDINATVNPFSTPLGYRLLDPNTNQELAKSYMSSIPNADLFGNSDSNYAHWETAPINSLQAQFELILELNLTDRDIGFFEGASTTGYIDTFCKVGPAAPVTRPVLLPGQL